MIVKEGNIFEDEHEAIGHGVNCEGVMGAGIAKEFRARFPKMYKRYRKYCTDKKIRPGMVYPYCDEDNLVWVYNMATQGKRGPNATLDAIFESAQKVLRHADGEGISYVAIPKIGCGIGGLDWRDVKEALKEAESVAHAEFVVYHIGGDE